MSFALFQIRNQPELNRHHIKTFSGFHLGYLLRFIICNLSNPFPSLQIIYSGPKKKYTKFTNNLSLICPVHSRLEIKQQHSKKSDDDSSSVVWPSDVNDFNEKHHQADVPA